MASPQKENGYTAIANEILDALARLRIPGESRQVLDVIIRLTYGWNRKATHITYKEFSERTGLRFRHIFRALRSLQEHNLIERTDEGYSLQKDYERWTPYSKNGVAPYTKYSKNGVVPTPKMEYSTTPKMEYSTTPKMEYSTTPKMEYGIGCKRNTSKDLPTPKDSIKDNIKDSIKENNIFILSHELKPHAITHKDFENLEKQSGEGNKDPSLKCTKASRKSTTDESPDKAKKTFLENVLLTEEEHKKLIDQLGEKKTQDYIERLNGYIHQIGKRRADAKYKSHYHTILNWHRRNQSEIERWLIVDKARRQEEEDKYFK